MMTLEQFVDAARSGSKLRTCLIAFDLAPGLIHIMPFRAHQYKTIKAREPTVIEEETKEEVMDNVHGVEKKLLLKDQPAKHVKPSGTPYKSSKTTFFYQARMLFHMNQLARLSVTEDFTDDDLRIISYIALAKRGIYKNLENLVMTSAHVMNELSTLLGKKYVHTEPMYVTIYRKFVYKPNLTVKD